MSVAKQESSGGFYVWCLDILEGGDVTGWAGTSRDEQRGM